MKFSKKMIVSIVTANVLFTIAVLYVFLKTGNEPMSLVVAWFGFTSIEAWNLMQIKKKEVENENRDIRDSEIGTADNFDSVNGFRDTND